MNLIKQNNRIKRSVLIIDDDVLIAEMIKDTMVEQGLNAYISRTGEEAVNIIRDKKVDIAFLDIVLPDCNGIELIRDIKKAHPDIRFIVITAHASTDYAIEALREGADDFIKKPFNSAELVKIINRIDSEKNLRKQRDELVNNLKDKLSRLRLIHDVITQITSSTGKESLIKNIMGKVKEFFNVEGVTLFFYDPEKEELSFEEVLGGSGDNLKSIKLKLGEGVAGWCALNREPVVVNNAYSDPRFSSISDKKTGYRTRNLICCPVEFDDKLFGVIELVNKRKGKFTQDDLELLTILAQHISIAISHLKIEAQLEEARKIEEMKKKEVMDLLNEKMKELKEVHNNMILAEKLASIGQYTAGIAHELNNPISFIYSNSEVLKEDVKTVKDFINDISEHLNLIPAYRNNAREDYHQDLNEISNKAIDSIEEMEEIANEIKEGAKRVVDIVKDLKRFAHSSDQGNRVFPLYSPLRVAEKILHSKLTNPEINYNTEVDDSILIEGNENQISQVIINLLSNSIDAVKEKGRGDVRVVIKSHGNWAELIVEDTGAGIDKDKLDKIFDPFFTTKPPGKGTGLGLSVVYRIIKDHKGDITVKSEKGEGTKFIIRFPLKKEGLTS